MIKEFTDFDCDGPCYTVWTWLANVKKKMSAVFDDKNKSDVDISLHVDVNTFEVTIIEMRDEAAGFREKNIRLIKSFVEREMPYYKFDLLREHIVDEDPAPNFIVLHFKSIEPGFHMEVN